MAWWRWGRWRAGRFGAGSWGICGIVGLGLTAAVVLVPSAGAVTPKEPDVFTYNTEYSGTYTLT